MTIEEIKIMLDPTLKSISDELYRLQCMDKPPKINEGKFAQDEEQFVQDGRMAIFKTIKIEKK